MVKPDEVDLMTADSRWNCLRAADEFANKLFV
jgi:hypothetical protein